MESNLENITNTEIKKAINQEIMLELSTKTNQEITQQLDYTIEVNTLDNEPLPFQINLTNPISLKVKIIAGIYSKILKDEVIVTCNINYPIFNLDTFLKNGLKMLYECKHPEKVYDICSINKYIAPNKKTLVVAPIGEPELNKNITTFNYFGESIFENNSDQNQTYQNPAWTKTIYNESLVSISSGVNMEASCSINAFGISVNVDFHRQTTITQGKSQTISVPNNQTIVKPHKKMQVLVYLNAFVSSQKITIDSDISGDVSASIIFKMVKVLIFQ